MILPTLYSPAFVISQRYCETELIPSQRFFLAAKQKENFIFSLERKNHRKFFLYTHLSFLSLNSRLGIGFSGESSTLFGAK